METAAIWKKYSSPLKSFILKKTRDEEVAKDILQEVFLKFHLHKTEIHKIQSLKPWLYKVANNSVMDYYRKRAKLPQIPETIPAEEEPDKHSPQDCLLPLINNLPEIYREALILSEIEGKKQAEVAQILNISLPGAKSRIQRGKKMLQEGFTQCCDYRLSDNGVLVGEHKSFSECKVCK